MEQTHSQSLMETAARHRQELQLEIERLRSAQTQAERTLDARERAHRQRIRGLEEQVEPEPWRTTAPSMYGQDRSYLLFLCHPQISTLKEQLQQELRRCQSHYTPPLLSGK